MRTMQSSKTKRIYSIDVARGLVVAFSVLLSHIPPGGYDLFRHADWYGITFLDFIFPSFLTLFGVGLGIAYFRTTKWKKVIRRTIILAIIGLLYNAIVNWNIDIATWRFTGVLQLYAVVGFVAVLILSVSRSWQFPIIIAIIVMITYGSALSMAGAGCAGGVIQPDCNVFGQIDAVVFGTQHMYAVGERGYDPEGLAVMFSSLANVLMGAAAGRIIMTVRNGKRNSRMLFMLAVALFIASPLLSMLAPIGKRMWSPAFASLTAAVTITLVAVIYMILDERQRSGRAARPRIPGFGTLEAFGRNSLLIYFGKYVILSLFVHITVTGEAGAVTIRDKLFAWVSHIPGDPQLNYAFIFFILWAGLAVILHRRRWYVRV